MTGDNELTEPMSACPECGSDNVSLMSGTALFHDGEEHFVLCFNCAAAGESSYDFGVETDKEGCMETAKQFWNAHGAIGRRSAIVALFGRAAQ